MAALGDPKRRAIVERLRRSPAPVGKIAETLPVPRPAVSQHLKVLTGADLVTVDPFGARRIYILRPEAIADLRAWCDWLCDDALTAFSAEARRIAAQEKDNK